MDPKDSVSSKAGNSFVKSLNLGYRVAEREEVRTGGRGASST